MGILRIFVNYADRLSEWSGKGISWFGLFLVLGLVYEIVARYVFNKPTAWSFDITYMLYGTLFMVGAAYTLRDDEHIRITIFSSALSPRARAIVDAICYLILFFPWAGALLYFGIGYAWEAWVLQEVSSESYWAPPIYPFMTVLPLAILLLLIEGMAKFTRCLVFIIKGREL